RISKSCAQDAGHNLFATPVGVAMPTIGRDGRMVWAFAACAALKSVEPQAERSLGFSEMWPRPIVEHVFTLNRGSALSFSKKSATISILHTGTSPERRRRTRSHEPRQATEVDVFARPPGPPPSMSHSHYRPSPHGPRSHAPSSVWYHRPCP